MAIRVYIGFRVQMLTNNGGPNIKTHGTRHGIWGAIRSSEGLVMESLLLILEFLHDLRIMKQQPSQKVEGT